MERVSLKFKHTSKNTMKLILAMLANQNLVRYIHYLSDSDPLDTNLPDANPLQVKEDNFILTQYNSDVLVENKISIFVNPMRGSFKPNDVTSNDQYTIDIVIPYVYWNIKDTGDIRAYQIAYEICQVIDFKKIAGLGNVEVAGWNSYKVDNQFSGLTLFVNVTNGTMNSGV